MEKLFPNQPKTTRGVQMIKSFSSIRASQAKVLAESLRTDLIRPLQELHQTQFQAADNAMSNS